MPPADLNRGKSNTPVKAYQPFCATPDLQIHTFPLFSQTSQFPPLNPDNADSSWQSFFLTRQKKIDIFAFSTQLGALSVPGEFRFACYGPDMIRRLLISQ